MQARPLHGRGRVAAAAAVVAIAGSFASLTACDKTGNDDHGAPPPPSAPLVTAAPGSDGGASACAGGGGTDSDEVSAPFFPRTVAPSAAAATFCLDPAGNVRTFGDRGKLTVDEVCTTGFDGECEVYKGLGLKRTVTLRYVGGSSGASVEVILSQFDSVTGAYAMFTKRVIADSDPTDPSATKPLPGIGGATSADARGAIGTGKAYAWRNDQLLELTYNDENVTPEQLAKDSTPVLVALATQVTARLPAGTVPACAAALPTAHLVPNGVQFYKKDLLDIPGAGAGAVGFYVDGTKRWRAVSAVDADLDKIKSQLKALHAKPGSLPVSDVAGADEAFHVVYQVSPDQLKTEWILARKGSQIQGAGDEEYALAAASAPEALAKARLPKADAMAFLGAWPLFTGPGSAAGSGGSASADGGAAKGAAGATSADSGAPRH